MMTVANLNFFIHGHQRLPAGGAAVAKTARVAKVLHSPQGRSLRRCLGYSMGELLVAMGIFAIGFLAIAAIFPAATHMQKQTTDEVLVEQIIHSVRALLQARPFSLANDLGHLEDGTDVQPLPGEVFQNKWSFRDRSFPSDAPVLTRRVNSQYIAIPTAKYYWTPLIRRTVEDSTNPSDYVIYVFITRGPGRFPRNPVNLGSLGKWAVEGDFREYDGWIDADGNRNIFTSPTSYWLPSENEDYFVSPGIRSLEVRRTPDSSIIEFANDANTDTGRDTGNLLIRPGDKILDSNGYIYTVTSAQPSEITVAGKVPCWNDSNGRPKAIWFAVPQTPDALCPTVAIIEVRNAVVP